MRPTYLHYDRESKKIFACTNRGTILRLNLDLEVELASDPVYNLNALNAILCDELYVYARELTGKLVRWRKNDLKFDRLVDLAAWSPSEAANFPNICHFLKLYNGQLYVAMPTGKVGTFRASDMSFVSQSTYTATALIECIETTRDEHFAVDFGGHLFRGHIDGEMKEVARLSHGATHQIIFDRRHERYWITDDFHCGLAMFKPAEPKKIDRLPLTCDDVEYMSFNPDQSELLVAAFDRYVYRLKNVAQPYVTKRYGPLKYQVTQTHWIEEDLAIAITESGEIYKINLLTGEHQQSTTGTNAIWDLKKSRTDKQNIFAAFEDGFVRELRIAEQQIKVVREKDLGVGQIRRILPETHGDLIALAASGQIMRLSPNFEPIWQQESKSLLRDMALHEDTLLVGGESGELLALSAVSGKVLWRKQLLEPLWAVTITPDGTQFLVGHRLNDPGDQGVESAGNPAALMVGDTRTGEITKKIPVLGNIKKFTWFDQERFIMNGNGSVATSLVNFADLNTVRKWSEWQLNTCEATLVLDDKIFTTTYGYQLNTYSFAGDILESAFPFEDYATSLIATEDGRILAGGRGAFLSVFTLKDNLPCLQQTVRF